MSDCEVVDYHSYCPPGVRRVLACGSSAFIGEVDASTVLKYPLEPGGDGSRLEHEHEILTLVGRHPRIVADKGLTAAGLFLERAANQTIYKFLAEPDHPAGPPPSLWQRLAWCRELAEAVEHVHARGVVHCDIQPTNILLDEKLHVKLADFQGNYVDDDGAIVYGSSGEPCRYFCPRHDELSADVKTDLFAMGSSMYFVLTGHEVFPDITGGNDGWNEKIAARFASDLFPEDRHAAYAITRKCWQRRYSSASEVLRDLEALVEDLPRR